MTGTTSKRRAPKGAGEGIELTGADLVAIAEARQGIPLPPELAAKLAQLVAAALRGERIAINLVRLP